MSLLEHALGHAADGIKVFPLKPREKTPLTKNGHLEATRDRVQILKWWTKHPDANIGLVCGDGLAVLDVDPAKGGEESLRALIEEFGPIRTKLVRTGSGGLHLYMKDDPSNPLPQTVGFRPGLDTRAGGRGYVVGAGSIHPNGTEYTLANGAAPGPVPDWLREVIASAPKKTSGGVEDADILEGERNHKLASLAGTLRDRGMAYEEILPALLAVNERRCSPPLEDEEVERIARSVARYKPERSFADEVDAADAFEADPDAEPETPRRPPARGHVRESESKLAAEVLPALRGRILWSPRAHKSWLVWVGHKWVVDESMEAERVIREELRQLGLEYQARADAAPGREGASDRALAKRCQSEAGISAISKLLRSDMACRITDFDVDRWLLNTPEGVIDLRTGDFVQREGHRMFLRSTAFAPRRGPAKAWRAFLQSLTGGDEELIRYLQKFLGYCLTGDMSAKVLVFHWGSNSDTGKSTYIKVPIGVLGDYGAVVDAAVFMHTRGDRVPAELAQLPGVRLVAATEPSAGQAWDEKKIKQITGGDPVQARLLFGNPFTYPPQFKLAFVGNHEPEVHQLDDAMKRRIHIVPLNKKIPREKQIEGLAERLIEEEGPEILQWMIEGCLLWQEEGLEAPAAVTNKTDEYAEDEDLLGQWLDETCEVGDPLAEVSREDLFLSYQQWMRARGEKVVGGEKTLKRAIDARKLPIKNVQIGPRRLRGYRGIRLRPHTEFGATEAA